MSSPRIFRTPEAIADLDEIWSFIARDRPAAADRVLDSLSERFVMLSENPELGEHQLADGTYRRFAFRS